MNLVFGASGYIGSNLTPYLIGQGKAVRASARNIEVLRDRGWDAAELVAADALDPASLDAALEGIDTAYYLVHSMAAGSHFPDIDAEAARNFAASAAGARVRRIVYLGGLIPEGVESTHLQSRKQTGDILREGAVPVTEIRAGMIIGPGSAAWEVIRDLVNHLPLMITPRWVKSRSTPIALGNLLRYLADVPDCDQTAGETYDVGGPDELTYEQIMRKYGRLVGKHPFIVPVPVLTPRLSSYWLRLVTAVPTSIARALIDGLSQDVVARDDRLQRLIPQELLGFCQAAADALDLDRQHAVPARWVEGSIACRNFRPEYAYYAKRAGDVRLTDASAQALWQVILAFGRDGDFFYANTLWWIRRALDWIVGGPSFRRARRHPADLRVGDVVDSWRVIAIQPGRRLTLLMEMRTPGGGVLEFEIAGEGDRRRLFVTAYWHPAGVLGLLYWYSLVPAHAVLFKGTTATIVTRARAMDLHPAS